MEDGDGTHLATIDWSSVYHLRFADSILGQLFFRLFSDSFFIISSSLIIAHVVVARSFSSVTASSLCTWLLMVHWLMHAVLRFMCVSFPSISYCTCGSSWLFCITASSFASSYVSACFVDDQSAFLACLHLQNMEFLWLINVGPPLHGCL